MKNTEQSFSNTFPGMFFFGFLILCLIIIFCFIFNWPGHGRTGSTDRPSKLICHICNKAITSRYYSADGKNYHTECFEKAEKCGYCGQPVLNNKGVRSKGKIYHYGCIKNLKRCAACNGLISGKYITSMDQAFHKECYDSLPKCMSCSGPVLDKDKILIANRACHKKCAQNVVICDVCGKMIKGDYIIDAYGRKCCSAHSETMRCFVCNYTGRVTNLGDSRFICDKCSKTAVTTLAQAQRIFTKIKSFLSRKYSINVEHPIKLHIGSTADLQEKWGDKWQMGLKGQFTRDYEYQTWSSGKVDVLKDEFTITLLSHMPADVLEGVLVHEYFHAWQAENFDEKADLALKEGSAETIAYIYNKEAGHTVWSGLQLKNQVDLYRNNLKKGLFLFDDLGNMQDFLKILTRMTTW